MKRLLLFLILTGSVSAQLTVIPPAGTINTTGNQTKAGVLTLTDVPILSLSNPRFTFTDTVSPFGTGEIAFTRGTNPGHTVMGFGPNTHLAFAGPSAINGSYNYSSLILEAEYVDGSAKVNDELYVNFSGIRQFFMQRNVTDGIGSNGIGGSFLVDGTATGIRASSTSQTMRAVDDRSGLATIAVENINAASIGAQLSLGRGYLDARGWDLGEGLAQNLVHKFSIRDGATNTFPFIIDSSDRIGIGHAYSDTLIAVLDVNGTARASKGVFGATAAPSGNSLLHVGPKDGVTGSSTPANTGMYINGPSGSSRNNLLRLGVYQNADFDLHFSTDYSSGTVGYIGTRDSGVDTDAVTIKGTNVTIIGALTTTEGVVGTATNNNATAGNVGEYASASVVQGSATALTTATPKTVTSISLTAGDWDITAIGSLTGASTGTEFDVAVGGTTNSLTGTVLGDTRCQTPTVSLTGADATLMVPAVRKSISSTTTFYLIVQETFTIGSPAAYGRISARRVR